MPRRLTRRGSSGRRIERPRTSRRTSCSPGPGRRGPEGCGVFRRGGGELNRAATGTDLVEVATAYEALAAAAGELASAVEAEDRASGLLPGGHDARRSVAYERLIAGGSGPVSSQTDRGAPGPRRCGSVVVAGSHSERRGASEYCRRSPAQAAPRRPRCARNARPTRTAGSVPWSIQSRIVCAVPGTRRRPAGPSGKLSISASQTSQSVCPIPAGVVLPVSETSARHRRGRERRARDQRRQLPGDLARVLERDAHTLGIARRTARERERPHARRGGRARRLTGVTPKPARNAATYSSLARTRAIRSRGLAPAIARPAPLSSPAADVYQVYSHLRRGLCAAERAGALWCGGGAGLEDSGCWVAGVGWGVGCGCRGAGVGGCWVRGWVGSGCGVASGVGFGVRGGGRWCGVVGVGVGVLGRGVGVGVRGVGVGDRVGIGQAHALSGRPSGNAVAVAITRRQQRWVRS